MVKLIWTDLAIDDLKSTHDYISLDSRVYARRQVSKIIKRVEQLQLQPQSERIVPEFSNENIRELIEGNYRLVYKTIEDKIFIVRIHHSARLLSAI
ncbi:MAG: type II toxin-antitoxin system RelE/ParE family toxin [Algoriphagus sp.]|nr:type II toxin-antitoxin system RelE/ParE family toxin [Algoriphagus sp.]